MRLTVDVVNGVLDQIATSLNGGALVFSTVEGAFQQELVRIPLPSPAFTKAFDGQALGHALPEMPIAVTGEAATARLETAAGHVVADLTMRTEDAADAAMADVLVDRTDFHRGGICRVAPLVLTMSRLS